MIGSAETVSEIETVSEVVKKTKRLVGMCPTESEKQSVMCV